MFSHRSGRHMSDEPARPRVLALDDDPLVLDVIRDSLEEGGFDVILTYTDEEALAAIEAEHHALAGFVTDVNLGSAITGWDVAHRARELKPTLPIVYVTGDSEHEWASKGVPNSVVVTKPFAAAQIVVALANLANRSD